VIFLSRYEIIICRSNSVAWKHFFNNIVLVILLMLINEAKEQTYDD